MRHGLALVGLHKGHGQSADRRIAWGAADDEPLEEGLRPRQLFLHDQRLWLDLHRADLANADHVHVDGDVRRGKLRGHAQGNSEGGVDAERAGVAGAAEQALLSWLGLIRWCFFRPMYIPNLERDNTPCKPQ